MNSEEEKKETPEVNQKPEEMEEIEKKESSEKMEENTETPETVSEVSQDKKKNRYNFPESFDEALENTMQEKCDEVTSCYKKIKEQQATLKKCESTLTNFKKQKEGITVEDVENAKKEFHMVKEVYMENAKKINIHLDYFHNLHLHFRDKLFLKQIYNTILAKLLASKDGIHPPEQYVVELAEKKFIFKEHELYLTEEDKRKGKTIKTLKEEYERDIITITNRLESRYKKRHLASLIWEGKETHEKLISRLKKLIEKDPDDLRSYILLATLYVQLLKKVKDHAQRVEIRDLTLQACEKAYSMIDVFLDLQGVTDVHKRDQIRVGFIKSISAIRNPLSGQKS